MCLMFFRLSPNGDLCSIQSNHVDNNHFITDQLMGNLKTTQSPTAALFTPDGKHIVSTIEDSCIHVWDYSQPNKKAAAPQKL
ncbi:hypothetical protein Bca4012_001430 [Brassica carinata]